MRPTYMLMIFVTFTAVEMLVFHANIASQIQQDDSNSRIVVVEPTPPPALSPPAPSPPSPSPSSPSPHFEEKPHNDTPPPVSDPYLHPQTHTSLPKQEIRDKTVYYDSLASGFAKTANASRRWKSDPVKYQCFLNSNFLCSSIFGIPNVNGLPAHFRHACAPAFIIPGTAKSGTTSLYFYLKEHPQVHQALSGQFNKEVRFFTEHLEKGAQWYLQQFPPIIRDDFPDKKIHMIHGEASPTYFYHEMAPALIKATIPNVKLIVVLRDPAERAYSDKMQLMANGIVYYNKAYDDMKYQIDAFTDCFTQAKMSHSTHMEAFFSCYNDSRLQEHVIGSHPYVMDSVYVYQVHNWLKYFPTEQILFINNMFHDTTRTMEKVTEFLGLCPFDWSPFVKTIHNRRDETYPRMPHEVRSLLVHFYKDFNEELYKLLRQHFKWPDTQHVNLTSPL